MSLQIRIKLSDEYETKFLQIAEASVGNKTVVKNELIEFAIDKFYKKLLKPGDINKLKREHAKVFNQVMVDLASDKNE